jgi:hypothetical protein
MAYQKENSTTSKNGIIDNSQEITSPNKNPTPPSQQSLKEEINKQLHTMLDYALLKGLKIPESIAAQIESPQMSDLLLAHNTMVEIIEPATPQSILLLNTLIKYKGLEGSKKVRDVPHIRNLMYFTLLVLFTIIAVSLSPEVNEKTITDGVLKSQGWTLLLNLIFISLSATLGVMFYLLKTLTVKIKNCTYIEENIVETRALIILGTIAGFIISEMLSINLTTIPNFDGIHKMSLAMLGGFSSDAIFSILRGLINKIKSLLTGAPDNKTDSE